MSVSAERSPGTSFFRRFRVGIELVTEPSLVDLGMIHLLYQRVGEGASISQRTAGRVSPSLPRL